MFSLATHQTLCRQFAALLEYPHGTARQAAACAGLLDTYRPDAAEPMARFLDFLASEPPARVEEVFTATFDLQPACHPYVGYQLCGESQKRAIFLMQLQQLYRQHGFAAGSELPDHLTTLLRFVASIDDRTCREEIVRDGLLPALDKILAGLAPGNHPYAALLLALKLFLAEPGASAVDATVQKETCS